MKIRLTLLLTVLFCAFAMTSVFGQSTAYVWTNQESGNITNFEIGNALNWTPNGIPNPNSNVGNPGDTMQFDGQTIGPLAVDDNGALNGGSSAGVVGIVWYVDGNQSSPVNYFYDGSGAGGTSIRTSNVQIDAGGGQLSWGNTNSSTSGPYIVLGGTTGQIHTFLNNSVNPMIIYPAFKVAMGGGGDHEIDFQGTGSFYITNSLIPDNSGSDTTINMDSTGKLIWQYANEPAIYTIS